MNKHNNNKTPEEKVDEIKKKFKAVIEKFKSLGVILKKNKKGLIVCASMLLICGAMFLNSMLSAPNEQKGGEVLQQTSTPDPTTEYFSGAVLSRQKARDEAIDVLQQVVDSNDAVEEVKAEAYSGINTIAKQIEFESNIEQLVLAKGFEQCLAVVNENSASIVVKSNGLLANEIAQIKEIVYEQSGVHPRDIKIIEKE